MESLWRDGVLRSAKIAAKRMLIHQVTNTKTPVFIFATPRGGSTWLAELVWSQPGMRYISEPLDLRDPGVRWRLGISAWDELYSESAKEKIARYFEALISGKWKFRDPLPIHLWRRTGFRYVYERSVLKIIHGATNMIPELCRYFDGRAVLLVRHPIATAISRESFPYLEALSSCKHPQNIDDALLDLVKRYSNSSSHVAKGVLAWCLYNQPAFANLSRDVLVVTYEQLLLEPVKVSERIAAHLALPVPEMMVRDVYRPSHTTRKSDVQTQRLLNREPSEERTKAILGKWRQLVSKEEEEQALAICEVARLPYYSPGELLPAKSLWLS